ncbi:hypothetical protein D8674_018859 [Pyrus ussuriensis x Pyrus communis]|uniref:Uncharacterized protein n=1 Tax=Pyrus ussuriensis x Pyrus communis TaxID=2448454 RepID=A0A5N5G6M2_9ROSA|nr:hypothetical protein D8674_018859 [Pyrus ussuriensis x Pyrus communis]
MSGSEGSNDEGSSSSGSRFELPRSSLESYEQEMLGNPHDHQTCIPSDEEAGDEHKFRDIALDIGASTSYALVVEAGILNAIPIFCSEFTADHLGKNLLDSKCQLEALRKSCYILNIVGIRLVHDGELPTDLPKGEPSFAQWWYYYKMRPAKSSTGYVYCIPYFDFPCSVDKVSKEGEASTKKGKKTMVVPVNNILFHKGARKHRVKLVLKPKSQEEVLKIAASKRVEAEAIGCVAATIAGDEKQLLPHHSNIDLIFPPVMEYTAQEGDLDFSRKRKYKEKDGSIPWKDLKLKKNLPIERDATVREFLCSQTFRHVIRPHCARKVQLEKSKWMAILDRYDGGGIIDRYCAEIEEHQQKGEQFILKLDPSSGDEFEDDTTVNEQTQQGKDGSGNAEDGDYGNGGETQHESSASDEGDSTWGQNCGHKPLALSKLVFKVNCLNLSINLRMSWGETSELLVVKFLPVVCDNHIGNAESAKDVLPYEVFYFCLSNSCQGFYFGPLCEVVNCNDGIMDLALPHKHWTYQIKSPLGEEPRADHRSERLRK